MNNFEFEWNDKKYWYSRSICVLGIIIGESFNKKYILANKRGPNTPDFQGHWCMPCGYLDFNETTTEAIRRETFEETGVYIPYFANIKLLGIDDNPENDIRQNVTIRYYCNIGNINKYNLTSINAEIKEVSDVKWISLEYANKYKWAFNHLALINKYIKEILEVKK